MSFEKHFVSNRLDPTHIRPPRPLKAFTSGGMAARCCFHSREKASITGQKTGHSKLGAGGVLMALVSALFLALAALMVSAIPVQAAAAEMSSAEIQIFLRPMLSVPQNVNA